MSLLSIPSPRLLSHFKWLSSHVSESEGPAWLLSGVSCGAPVPHGPIQGFSPHIWTGPLDPLAVAGLSPVSNSGSLCCPGAEPRCQVPFLSTSITYVWGSELAHLMSGNTCLKGGTAIPAQTILNPTAHTGSILGMVKITSKKQMSLAASSES